MIYLGLPGPDSCFSFCGSSTDNMARRDEQQLYILRRKSSNNIRSCSTKSFNFLTHSASPNSKWIAWFSTEIECWRWSSEIRWSSVFSFSMAVTTVNKSSKNSAYRSVFAIAWEEKKTSNMRAHQVIDKSSNYIDQTDSAEETHSSFFTAYKN